MSGISTPRSTTIPKLDDLAAPDDNTDLNSSITKHGLFPKLSNVAAQFLNGVGTWINPIDPLVIASSGQHAIGVAPTTVDQLNIGGNVTAPGGSSALTLSSVSIRPIMIPVASQTAVRGLSVLPTFTNPATGTIPIAIVARFKGFSIAAGGTVTEATTVRIESAPDGAVNNYALYVAAGVSRFDGDIVFGNGLSSILRTATVDGADNLYTIYCGGGAAAQTRGAIIVLYGNEASGKMQLEVGNVAGSAFEFVSRAGAVVISIDGGTGAAGFLASVYPMTDNLVSLGDVTHRWTAVYAVNGTIQTSDAREKRDIANTHLGLDFINSLSPRRYRWRVGVGGGGVNPNRIHHGFIAEEIARLPQASQFAGIVYNDEGEPIGLNYSEFVAPLVRSIQELTTRVQQLEG